MKINDRENGQALGHIEPEKTLHDNARKILLMEASRCGKYSIGNPARTCHGKFAMTADLS
jgi:hypothetical protein